MIKLTRWCMDCGDDQTVADIYHLQGLYPQALHYRLKRLQESKLGDSFTKIVQNVVRFYIRMCKEQNVSESRKNTNYENTINHIFQFWHENSLDVGILEELLLEHLDTLGCCLSLVLFRKTNEDAEESLAWGGVSSALQKIFSTRFCLQVASSVMHQIDNGLLTQSDQTSFDATLMEMNMLTDTGSDREINIPPEKLWQEIVQNLRKDLDLRDHVLLSTADINTLLDSNEKQEVLSKIIDEEQEGDSKKGRVVAKCNVVVFTCGHHYGRKMLTEDVLPSFVMELSKGKTALPNCANLLNQYYRSQGIVTMACPKCVLNSVQLTDS